MAGRAGDHPPAGSTEEQLIMRITAIGDLHGTLDSLLAILGALEYIDAKLNWTEGDIHIVLTGDCVDRGYNSADIYKLLIKWQKQAPLLGSEIHFVIGNHEVMNMFGFGTYNTREEYAGFASYPGGSGEQEFREAFSEGGWVYNWIIRQHAIVKLGNIIWAHGDLPAALSTRSVAEIESGVMNALLSAPRDTLYTRSLPEPLFSSESSILWSRQAGYEYTPGYEEKLASFLELNNADLYVCGHTPSRSGEFILKYGGRYLCIDTGMVFKQRGMGKVSALQIEEDVLTACYFTRGGINRKIIQL